MVKLTYNQMVQMFGIRYTTKDDSNVVFETFHRIGQSTPFFTYNYPLPSQLFRYAYDACSKNWKWYTMPYRRIKDMYKYIQNAESEIKDPTLVRIDPESTYTISNSLVKPLGTIVYLMVPHKNRLPIGIYEGEIVGYSNPLELKDGTWSIDTHILVKIDGVEYVATQHDYIVYAGWEYFYTQKEACDRLKELLIESLANVKDLLTVKDI